MIYGLGEVAKIFAFVSVVMVYPLLPFIVGSLLGSTAGLVAAILFWAVIPILVVARGIAIEDGRS